jgi:hypothetical protein
MRYSLLLFFFIFMIGHARGQDANVTPRKFDEKKWKEIVGSTNYEEDPVKKEPEKQRSSGAPWFSLPGISPALLKAISFAVVFALFAFILYYVSRNASFGASKKKIKPADIAAPVENIDELDIEGLLRDALASGDLRLAVRVHYLLLLKKLNEVGLIAWKKDKTNRDYLSELYGRNACYDDVRELTLAYELVWYGERSVSSDSFQKLNGEFESVNRRITEVQPAA